MYHSFFTHSSSVRYLGCFHAFSAVNCSAINVGMQATFSYAGCTSFGYISRRGIAVINGRSIFNYLSIFHSDFHILYRLH